MTAPTKTPPPWLDLSTPRSDRARRQQCPRCHAPILRALVGRVAALDVRVDPWPLTPEQEYYGRTAERLTWCLLKPAYGPHRLIWRSRSHAEGGRCRHAVLIDHQCTATDRSAP